MKKKTCVLIISVVLLVSIVAWVMVANIHYDKSYAQIYQNGKLIYSIDLSTVYQPYEITVGENGQTNTILVRHGEIGIIKADCPDKVCVNEGFISDGAKPIVCLPNRLIIQIEKAVSFSDVDGVAR